MILDVPIGVYLLVGVASLLVAHFIFNAFHFLFHCMHTINESETVLVKDHGVFGKHRMNYNLEQCCHCGKKQKMTRTAVM